MFKQYINGKLVDGKGRVMEVIDPATSEVIDTVGCANAEQTEEALQAAAKAFKEITENVSIPVVADIHFDYKMAILAMENGAHKIKNCFTGTGGPLIY